MHYRDCRHLLSHYICLLSKLWWCFTVFSIYLKKILQSSFKKGNQETQADVTDSLPEVQAPDHMKATSISLVMSLLRRAPYSLGRQPALLHKPDLLLPPHSLRGGGTGSTWGQPLGNRGHRSALAGGRGEQRRQERPKDVQGPQKQKAFVCIRDA